MIVVLHRQRREYRVFEALLQMVPGLEDRLMNGSENDVVDMAESVSVYIPHLNTSCLYCFIVTKRCLGC